MKLFKLTGLTEYLANKTLLADTIDYVSSDFPFPTFTNEEIAAARDCIDSVVIPFNGDYLPEDVKAALFDVAQADIEEITEVEALPPSLVGGASYFLEAFFADHTNFVTDVVIGVELLVNKDWTSNRDKDAAAFKQYIALNAQKGHDITNLTKMCTAYSGLRAVLWTHEEHDALLDLLKKVDEVKRVSKYHS